MNQQQDAFLRGSSCNGDGARRRRRRQPSPQEDSSNNTHYNCDSSTTNSNRRRHRQPKPPRSSSSSSSSSLWKQQLVLWTGTLISLGIWYLTPLSELVVQDILLPLVPVSADVQMGQAALLELKGHRRGGGGPQNSGSRGGGGGGASSSSSSSRDVYDSNWTPLIQSIGWELVEAAGKSQNHGNNNDDGDVAVVSIQDYSWNFGIIQQTPPIVNAFCLPGGIIRITQKLLQQLDLTHGELAALLGHEMGHALHRHAQARRLQHQVLTYVLKALVYQDDDDHEESFGEAVGELLVNSVDWLGQQSFSRRDEYQADATSWDLLVASRRYDPRAMQSLLQKLWAYHGQKQRGDSGGRTSWDSTHPGTLDRIEALQRKYDDLTAKEKRQLRNQNTVL